MQLQRIVTRRIGDKEYIKYQVTLRRVIVHNVGWNGGTCLEARVTPKGVMIYRVEPKPRTEKPTYGQFRDAVVSALKNMPQGGTWSEIRQKTGWPQKTPSPIWVKEMEVEKVLERIRDPTGSRFVWRRPETHIGHDSKWTLNGWTERASKNDKEVLVQE